MPMISESQPSDRQLKRRAHALKPIVKAGANGMSDGVLAELDGALVTHELVKIRVDADDRPARRAMIEHACDHLGARCIQQIGHTATLYRANPEPAGDSK